MWTPDVSKLFFDCVQVGQGVLEHWCWELGLRRCTAMLSLHGFVLAWRKAGTAHQRHCTSRSLMVWEGQRSKFHGGGTLFGSLHGLFSESPASVTTNRTGVVCQRFTPPGRRRTETCDEERKFDPPWTRRHEDRSRAACGDTLGFSPEAPHVLSSTAIRHVQAAQE